MPLVTRAGKGAALTIAEHDGNLTHFTEQDTTIAASVTALAAVAIDAAELAAELATYTEDVSGRFPLGAVFDENISAGGATLTELEGYITQLYDGTGEPVVEASAEDIWEVAVGIRIISPEARADSKAWVPLTLASHVANVDGDDGFTRYATLTDDSTFGTFTNLIEGEKYVFYFTGGASGPHAFVGGANVDYIWPSTDAITVATGSIIRIIIELGASGVVHMTYAGTGVVLV